MRKILLLSIHTNKVIPKFYLFFWVVFACILLNCSPTKAQSDFNLVQYFHTPLLTNPAWIASGRDVQVYFNYRNQPNAISDNFQTSMATAIYPFINRNTDAPWGGIALSFLDDKAGNFLNTGGALLGYAHNVKIGENSLGNNFLSLGFQGGFFQRSVNLDGLTTSSQFSEFGFFDENALRKEFSENLSQNYWLLSTGLLWHTADSEGRLKSYLGFSGFNINRPNIAFYNGVRDNLPVHFTLIGGYHVSERNKISFLPNFRYIRRTGNNEIIGGTWLHYNLASSASSGFLKEGKIGMGLWYNFNNSFVTAFELNQPNYLITCSFDLPTASSSTSWQGNNAFEITLSLKLRKRNTKRFDWQFIQTIAPINSIAGINNPYKVDINPIALTIKTKPKLQPKTKPGFEDGAFRFKINSQELDEISEILLDSVVQVLVEYPQAKIEFGGHTCNLGSTDDNLQLSQKRVVLIKQYILRNSAIFPERVSSKIYADKKPLLPNTTEANRKKNRRVSFKIIYPES